MLNRSLVPRDCRHGRVLLQKFQECKFIVWDTITGDRKELDQPRIPYQNFSVAVLCATPGTATVTLDHSSSSGCAMLSRWHMRAFIHHKRVPGARQSLFLIPIDVADFVNPRNHGALGRDGVYFVLGSGMGSRILKYDLEKHCLSVIDPPESYKNGIFVVPTEDGLLGVAGIKGSSLDLWLRKVNAEGVEGWMQYRAIELKTLFPDDKLLDEDIVIAFAEGVRVIFMDTSRGISIIDLNTEKAMTVSEPERHYAAVPFMCFYTPDCACGKLPLPAETN